MGIEEFNKLTVWLINIVRKGLMDLKTLFFSKTLKNELTFSQNVKK